MAMIQLADTEFSLFGLFFLNKESFYYRTRTKLQNHLLDDKLFKSFEDD